MAENKRDQLGNIFDKCMIYIIEKNYREAAMAFLSDTDKIGYDVGVFLMPLLSVNNNNTTASEIIKILSGFSSMPERVFKYYENPELALKEYSEKYSK